MSGNGRESLPYVQEWLGGLPDVWELSGGHPGCPGVVRRTSRMRGSGREFFLDDREWS